MTQGTLYVISAPSGAGKTSLVKALIENMDDICVSVSHTTRPIRPSEQNGIHYHFVTKDEFMDMLNQNLFLEHAQVFDNYYGTSQLWVMQQLKKGIDVILEIDWQGAQQIRKLQPDCIGIFILPPSKKILEQRLRGRGQDSDDIIARRMRDAVDEMNHYVEFEYLVVNDVFQKALADLQHIIYAQRLTHHIQTQKLENLLIELNTD
jgi:guanylate kinase